MGPPPGAVTGSRQFLDAYLTLDPGNAPQLLGHDRSLQSTACVGSGMRVIAASGTARSGDGAARIHPVRGRRQDLHGIGSTERSASVLGHPGNHSLSWQTVTNEHHPAVVASHAESPVPRCAQFDLEQQPEPALGHLPAGGS